jgi:hypothetical protein
MDGNDVSEILSPDECANLILNFIRSNREYSAFKKLNKKTERVRCTLKPYSSDNTMFHALGHLSVFREFIPLSENDSSIIYL